MSLKVTKSTEVQAYEKDESGWLLNGLQESEYDSLLPIWNAYSDNRSITEINLIKLGVNKQVLSTTSLATDLIIYSGDQYIIDTTKTVNLSTGIFKIQFKNGFDIYETEPFLQDNVVVQYRNGVVTNSFFGNTAVFDFEAKINLNIPVVFTINWGSEVGITTINSTLVKDVWKALQATIAIPEGISANQTILVTDNFGGSFEVEYIIKISIPIPELNYWPFLGNTDDIIGGNDGINNGAALTTDKGGNPNSAYLFVAGEGDWMDSTSNGNIGKVYSITVRMKPILDYSFIFLNNGLTYYNFFNSTTNFIHNVNGNNVQFTISPQLNTSQYYDFAILRNGTSVEFYVDAVKQDITETLAANEDYIFAELTRNGSFSYDGVLDNMRIYNSILTQEELTNITNES